MDECENNKFQKKVNVPTQYREASKILRKVLEEKKSVKELVYSNKHVVIFFFQ